MYKNDFRAVYTGLNNNWPLTEGLDKYLKGNALCRLWILPDACAHPEGSIKPLFFFFITVVLLRGGFLNSAL